MPKETQTQKPQLVKTKYGFWQYQPVPTKEELLAYYANRYYQEDTGSYTVTYTEEEIKHFHLKSELIFKQIERLRKKSSLHSILDVGCGEGWVLDKFQKEGWCIQGIDFSSFALKKFNPHLADCFEQGDLYKTLSRYFSEQKTFDVIILSSVMEHVLDPIDLLEKVKRLLRAQSLLVLMIPNDFSPFHEYLLKEGFIDKPFWLAYPDHISCFNKESMTSLLEDKGYKIEAVVANNPIDFNILNANSNYARDPSKGKNTHFFRVRVDNFLASINIEKLLDIYTIYGEMGVGRCLYFYCSLR